jgi:hypothetical protein
MMSFVRFHIQFTHTTQKCRYLSSETVILKMSISTGDKGYSPHLMKSSYFVGRFILSPEGVSEAKKEIYLQIQKL